MRKFGRLCCKIPHLSASLTLPVGLVRREDGKMTPPASEGFSCVWKGRHNGRVVALKQFLPYVDGEDLCTSKEGAYHRLPSGGSTRGQRTRISSSILRRTQVHLAPTWQRLLSIWAIGDKRSDGDLHFSYFRLPKGCNTFTA